MIQSSFEWKFKCNEQRTARQRAGHFLRWIASKIDGRLSLAISIESKPELSSKDRLECVSYGLGKIKWAVAEATRMQAEELILEHVIRQRVEK